MRVKTDPKSFGFELYSGKFRKNAYPVYTELREHYPVYPIRMPTGAVAWVLTRYEDCVNFNKDPRIVKDPKNVPGMPRYEDLLGDKTIAEIVFNNVASTDPPDHTRMKKLIHKAFVPKMIMSLREKIQNLVDGLLDKAEEKEEVDLIADFARPFPLIVICDLLGIPNEDRALFSKWSNSFMENVNDPTKMGALLEAVMEYVAYMKEIFADRKGNPRDDLVSALVQAEEDGDKLSEAELYSTVFILIIAGHETTSNMVGNSTLALLEQPERWEQLKQQPELLSSALEECIRFYSPVEVNTNLFVAEDMQVHGQLLSIGDMVITVYASANRDPRQFINPDQFDMKRIPNNHIAFGHGVHYCIGAPLSRMEGQIAFSTLLRRWPNLTLNMDPTELELTNHYLTRGLKTLPVLF